MKLMMSTDTPSAAHETFGRIFCVNNECHEFLFDEKLLMNKLEI